MKKQSMVFTFAAAMLLTASAAFAADLSDESLKPDLPYVIVDDELVTVRLTDFYEEEVTYAGNDARMEKCFELSVSNRSGQEMNLLVSPVYLAGEEAEIVPVDGIAGPAPRQTGLYHYRVSYPSTQAAGIALESLDELFELSGWIQVSFLPGEQMEEAPLSREYKFDLSETWGQSPGSDSGTEEIDKDQFKNAVALLNGKSWYFNGGSECLLNQLFFEGDRYRIEQIRFDADGGHENGGTSGEYYLDENRMILYKEDGDILDIPYKAEDDRIFIGDGDFLTRKEIEEDIQGHWMCREVHDSEDEVVSVSESHIQVDPEMIRYETASPAGGGQSGKYHYYGLYFGTYTLLPGGFKSDIPDSSQWCWNVIDGQVTVLHGDQVCERVYSVFPGEDGYNFDWYYLG